MSDAKTGRSRTGNGPTAPFLAATRPKAVTVDTSQALRPRRSGLTQAERTAMSDQRMFDAAIKLISAAGAGRTTLKEIGELAGYSRGLANYRFGSKDRFVGELLTHLDTLWQQELDNFVGDRRGLAALTAAIDAVEHFVTRQTDGRRALYILWFEAMGCEPHVRERLALQHDAWRRTAQRWIREGIKAGEIDAKIDPALFAIQFQAFVTGTIYQWLVNPNAVDIKDVFAQYRRLMLLLLGRH